MGGDSEFRREGGLADVVRAILYNGVRRDTACTAHTVDSML